MSTRNLFLTCQVDRYWAPFYGKRNQFIGGKRGKVREGWKGVGVAGEGVEVVVEGREGHLCFFQAAQHKGSVQIKVASTRS